MTAKPRLLIVSSLFPPNIIGGAERSACNIGQMHLSNGHEVGVLTTAANKEQECDGKVEDGLKVWRQLMPRPYQMMDFLQASKWKKPLWHAQDHFDPRNRSFVRKVLDQFKPDWVNVNFIQGIGYNALQDLAEYGAPVVFHLHDLGLACIRMSMFSGGKNCEKQCSACAASSKYKADLFKKFDRVGFSSPSQANIDTLAKFFPVKIYPNIAVLNPNKYPAPNQPSTPSKKFRIIYVGRVHETKGVDLALEVIQKLAGLYEVEFNVIGGGPILDEVRAKYGSQEWCHIHGFLSQQEIANFMQDSEVMVVPSIWAENSPGVVVHANQLGLPTIGSRKGGIPELVADGETGLLVEPGNRAAWYDALENLIKNREIVDRWKAELAKRAEDYGISKIYGQSIQFYEKVRDMPVRRQHG